MDPAISGRPINHPLPPSLGGPTTPTGVGGQGNTAIDWKKRFGSTTTLAIPRLIAGDVRIVHQGDGPKTAVAGNGSRRQSPGGVRSPGALIQANNTGAAPTSKLKHVTATGPATGDMRIHTPDKTITCGEDWISDPIQQILTCLPGKPAKRQLRGQQNPRRRVLFETGVRPEDQRAWPRSPIGSTASGKVNGDLFDGRERRRA